MQNDAVGVGLVGYGFAGRTFHAPVIAGVPGLRLAAVASSQPDVVLRDWPQTRVVAEPAALLASPDVDLVVIATPNDSHHPLARAALEAGKHVVVDKPFTMDLAEAEDLLALAKAKARVLSVFHNRRFDADFLTLQDVLSSGRLGRLVYFASHFDRYRPQVLARWRDSLARVVSGPTWARIWWTRPCSCWVCLMPSMPTWGLSVTMQRLKTTSMCNCDTSKVHTPDYAWCCIPPQSLRPRRRVIRCMAPWAVMSNTAWTRRKPL